MIVPLLEHCGPWAFVLGPLLVWATALLLHRGWCRVQQHRVLARVREALRRLERVWENAAETPNEARQAFDDALAKTRAVHALLGDAISMPETAFAAELLPRLAPRDERARANGRQLEMVASLAPAAGLAGTVAGFATLFADIAKSGMQNGLADLAGPGRLAMMTTLCGLLCLGVALMTLGLVHVDPDRETLRAEFVRWHGTVRRAAARIGERASQEKGFSGDAEVTS